MVAGHKSHKLTNVSFFLWFFSQPRQHGLDCHVLLLSQAVKALRIKFWSKIRKVGIVWCQWWGGSHLATTENTGKDWGRPRSVMDDFPVLEQWVSTLLMAAKACSHSFTVVFLFLLLHAIPLPPLTFLSLPHSKGAQRPAELQLSDQRHRGKERNQNCDSYFEHCVPKLICVKHAWFNESMLVYQSEWGCITVPICLFCFKSIEWRKKTGLRNMLLCPPNEKRERQMNVCSHFMVDWSKTNSGRSFQQHSLSFSLAFIFWFTEYKHSPLPISHSL
jgi:hypothetical protein